MTDPRAAASAIREPYLHPTSVLHPMTTTTSQGSSYYATATAGSVPTTVWRVTSTTTIPSSTSYSQVPSMPAVLVGTGVGMASAPATEVPVMGKYLNSLPNQQQIERTLERAREQVNIAKHETEGLSNLGEQILTDAERLLDSTSDFLREKNEGNKLQQLAKEAYLAKQELTSNARNARDVEVLSGFKSERLRSLARETLQTARLAGLELVRSRRFRTQVRTLINLLLKSLSSESVEDSTQLNSSSAANRASSLQEPYPGLGHDLGLAPGEIEIPISATRMQRFTDKFQTGLVLTYEHLNSEQMDQLANNFMSLITDISQRRTTSDLFRRILDLFLLFGEEFNDDRRHRISGGLRDLTDSEHLRRSLILSKELFETFTQSRRLDPMLDHLREISFIVTKDEETRNYLHSLRRFIIFLLDHPEELRERETLQEMRSYIRWAQSLHQEKLKPHLIGLLGEAKSILHQLEQDPTTVRLKNDAKALLTDIVLDERGNIVLKTEAVEQLRLIIIQSLIERLRVPLPAIYREGEDLQLRLSNMVVTLRDIIPESVVMRNTGRMEINLTNLKEGVEASARAQEFVIEIRNMNIFIEDANIWFRRTKFPKTEDEGKIRISVGGSGVDLTIKLRTLLRSQDILQVDQVTCDVHNMKLHLYETRHNFIYNAVAKALSGRIRRNLEHSIENNVTDYLQRINRILSKQITRARAAGTGLGVVDSLKGRIVGPAASTPGPGVLP